ncbi:MAG: AAA family ATPase [Shimia sp.]
MLNTGTYVQPLRNVSALVRLVKRLQTRQHGLPGMATFYGWTGLGKSMAASHVAVEENAVYVSVQEVWTKSALLDAFLTELCLPKRGTIAQKFEAVKTGLAVSDRPVLIDEADYLVKKRLVQMVRDLYDHSFVPIVLIGEETMPQKLNAIERVAGRMLDWVAAEPVDLRDAQLLAGHYAPQVEVSDEVLQALIDVTQGSARMISTQLAHYAERAKINAMSSIELDDMQRLPSERVTAPAPRKAAGQLFSTPGLRVVSK